MFGIWWNVDALSIVLKIEQETRTNKTLRHRGGRHAPIAETSRHGEMVSWMVLMSRDIACLSVLGGLGGRVRGIK